MMDAVMSLCTIGRVFSVLMSTDKRTVRTREEIKVTHTEFGATHLGSRFIFSGRFLPTWDNS